MNKSSKTSGLYLAGIFLIVQLLFVSSCKKETLFPVDSRYPTSFLPLNTDSLLQLRIQYHSKYPFVFTGIDAFGFFGGYDTFQEAWPAMGPSLLQEEAADVASRFLIDNPGSSGVTKQSLSFNSIEHKPDNFGNDHWHLNINHQFIDTIEVGGSGISLKVMNGEIYMCNGHWYPYVYIPTNFDFTKEKTLERLTNYSLKYSTLGGVKYHKLTFDEIQNAHVRLMIYPVESKSIIKMHVVWVIHASIYQVTVDVMTGEVLSEGADILS